MEHLQQFKVEFEGVNARKDDDGSIYYRNFFTIDGKEYSVRNPEKLGGLQGTVLFVKKGEQKPGGGVVAENGFSLLKSVTIEELERTIRRKKLTRESADLG